MLPAGAAKEMGMPHASKMGKDTKERKSCN